LSISVILARLSIGEMVCAVLLVGLLPLGAWLGYRAWKRSRISPEEAERQRRATLHATGKMGDATLVDMRGNLLFYSYAVRGVEYTATQDVSALQAMLPSDPTAVNSVVFVKYDPRNPANSIILCEEWSGLRSPRAVEG
jgi:hypothetical protein